MSPKESIPLAMLVKLLSADFDSEVHLSVLCASDRRRLATENAQFVLRIWCENPRLVRASITNLRTGTVAMVQGNEALRELAREVAVIEESG